MILATLITAGFNITKAQGILSKLKMGVKTETNYSGFILSDMDNVKSTMGAGVSIGSFIRFNISDHFAIQEDIMFVYNTSKITINGVEDSYRYFGTEVPIYFTGQWNTPSGGRFYGELGVYFGLGFSAKLKDSDYNFYKKYDGNKTFLKRLTNGFASQIGYEFENKLQINANYKIGLNALDANKNNSKMLPQSVSIGIGYGF